MGETDLRAAFLAHRFGAPRFGARLSLGRARGIGFVGSDETILRGALAREAGAVFFGTQFVGIEAHQQLATPYAVARIHRHRHDAARHARRDLRFIEGDNRAGIGNASAHLTT